MMGKKYANIRIDVTVSFEDDEETALEDQAINEALSLFNPDQLMFAEVVGPVRDEP